VRLFVRLKPLPAKKVSSASSSGCLPESTRKPPSFMQQRPQSRRPLCYQNSQALVNSRFTSSLPQPIRLPILRGPCVAAARLEKSRPAENNPTEADVGMVTVGQAIGLPGFQNHYRKGVLIRLATLGRTLLSSNEDCPRNHRSCPPATDNRPQPPAQLRSAAGSSRPPRMAQAFGA
jgi:hypothetical protein